jgi:hypothetical protein
MSVAGTGSGSICIVSSPRKLIKRSFYYFTIAVYIFFLTVYMFLFFKLMSNALYMKSNAT